jgi:hypothetical protein
VVSGVVGFHSTGGCISFLSRGGVHGRGISTLGIGVLRVGSAGLGHWVHQGIYRVYISTSLYCFVVVTQDIDWNGEMPLEGSNPDVVNG